MKTTALLATMAIVLMATTAQAQTNVAAPKAFTIKVGGNFPTTSEAKNAGNTWLAAGVDFVPKSQAQSGTAVAGGQQLVYADYASASKNGLSDHYFAIGVGTRAESASNARSGASTFYEGGIGAYFQSAKQNSTSSSKSGTALGVKTGIGMNVFGNVFVEGTYTYIFNKVNGVGLNGFGAFAGMRF